MPIIIDVSIPPQPPSPVVTPTLAGYVNLVTSEHNKRTKLIATLLALITPVVETSQTLDAMAADFDLDTAIGAQLDIVGQWVGLSRNVPTALTGVYFSLDVEGLGLDQGSLQGPNDPVTGLVVLPDDTYRQFLRVQIAKNRWDGSISQAVAVLDTVLAGQDIRFVLQDGGDMTMILGMVGTGADAVVRALFRNGFLDFKPAGVGIARMISVNAPLFGLDVENASISGLDVGAFSSI